GQKILAAHRAIRGARKLPHCVGNVSDRTMFLLGPRPSLANLRGRQVLVVRLVHQYYGAVRLLLNVHVRRSVYHLRGLVLIFRPRRPGDLPVLVHVVSQRAQVLRLRRTGWLTKEKMRECRWVKPVLVAQFEFTEWTPEAHLRHSRFMGLREDKQAKDVAREMA